MDENILNSSDNYSQKELIKKVFKFDNHSQITNLSFNTTYSLLSVSTSKGVYLFDFEKSRMERLIDADEPNNQHLKLVVDYSYGPTVGVESIYLSQNFVVLKSNGALQVWNLTQQKILQTIQMNIVVRKLNFLKTFAIWNF